MAAEPQETMPAEASAERLSVISPSVAVFGHPGWDGLATMAAFYEKPDADVGPCEPIEWTTDPTRRIVAVTENGGLFYVAGNYAYQEYTNPETGILERHITRLSSLEALPPTEIRGRNWDIPGLPGIDSEIKYAAHLQGRHNKEQLEAWVRQTGKQPEFFSEDIFAYLEGQIEQTYRMNLLPDTEETPAPETTEVETAEPAQPVSAVPQETPQPDIAPKAERRQPKERFKRLKQARLAGKAAVTNWVIGGFNKVGKMGRVEKTLGAAVLLVGGAVAKTMIAKAGIDIDLPLSGGGNSHASTVHDTLITAKPSESLNAGVLASSPTKSVTTAHTLMPIPHHSITSADTLTMHPRHIAQPPTEYVVRPNDNLTKIAEHDLRAKGIDHPSQARIDHEVDRISKLNDDLLDGDPDHIEPKWRLKIPRPRRFWKS